ncbi:MAG: hypothetical protein RLZZ172_1871 [Bacteroidota bacterium]
MKKINILVFLLLVGTQVLGQQIKWGKHTLLPVNAIAKITQLNGESVLEVTRDLVKSPFDINKIESSVDGPTFVKLLNVDIDNGVIAVKMLSTIQENSPFPQARGFIGLAYRIDENNANFENIYLRPSNGRADDQLRRNHTVQYFTYPGHTFSSLRKEANGLYETYADIGLNEWIDIRIEFHGEKAQLYINNQKSPNFIVNKMLGKSKNGSIGLWVEVGTIGYFKDLEIKKNGY